MQPTQPYLKNATAHFLMLITAEQYLYSSWTFCVWM